MTLLDQASNFNWITLLTALTSASFAYGTATFVERYKNRKLVLRKLVDHILIGESSSNNKWGDIVISYNGNPVQTLYLFTVEIRNNTFLDAPPGMPITFSVPGDSYFLRASGVLFERSSTLQVPSESEFAAEFNAVTAKWNGMAPQNRTADHPWYQEIIYIRTHRKFQLPVLNRNTRAHFELLVSGDTMGQVPDLAVGIYEKGISLEWLDSPRKQKRRKLITDAVTFSLCVAAIFPISWYAPSIAWAAWLTFASGFVVWGISKGVGYMLKVLNV